MSDISPYLANKIIRWMAAQAFPSAPASVYIGLWNGNPLSGGTEVTTTVRVAGRVAVDFEAAPSAGTDNDITTDGDSDFGTAAGDATVTYIALHDASSAGNVLFSKLISTASISTGMSVKVAAGDLTITVS